MSGSSSSSRADSSGFGSSKPGLSWSSSRRSSYEERSVDPPAPPLQAAPRTLNKAYLRDADRKEGEATGFIPAPGPAPGPAPAPKSCCRCPPPHSCRGVLCSLLTCGLYRLCVRAPCLPPADRAPQEEAEPVSFRAAQPTDAQKVEDLEKREEGEEESGWLEDVCIGGVRVGGARELLQVESGAAPYSVRLSGPVSPHHSLGLEDWEDGEENVDSLIAKKLLELYSEYQIEELARCTSDSIFLRKSKAINQLINSLAEEHQMNEQEAECRLVRGIIRISTRKSKRRPPLPSSSTSSSHTTAATRLAQRTLSDSGNETMRDSDSFCFSNNNDYKSNPNIQISELTNSDQFARDMWRNRGQTSSSSSAYSPSHTETESSAAPLIRTSVRT